MRKAHYATKHAFPRFKNVWLRLPTLRESGLTGSHQFCTGDSSASLLSWRLKSLRPRLPARNGI